MTATLADLRRSLNREGPYADGRESWLADMAVVALHQDGSEPESVALRARLAEHVMEVRDASTRANVVLSGLEIPVELRASTLSTFNGLAPPQYIIDQWAASRSGRKAPDWLSTPVSIVGTGTTTRLSRFTTPAAVDAQTAENATVTSADPVATEITIPIAAIGGQIDTSRAVFERSAGQMGERANLAELFAQYDRRLSLQFLYGTGAAGQALGLVNQPGIITQAVTTATTAAISSAVAGAASQIATAVGCGYEEIKVCMHPRRVAAILRDVAGLEVGSPTLTIAGLPVASDPNIRTTLGAGTNEDEILLTWPPGVLAHLDPPATFTFDQVLGPATVRIAIWGYHAVALRYPQAVARVSGAGLVAPTF